MSPYVLGEFIDKLIIGADRIIIAQFCISFGVICLFKIIKDYATSVLYTKMQNKMGYKINMYIIKHIQRLSLSFINHKDVSYLNQRINGDSYAIISFCLKALRDATINVILIVVPFFILFSLNTTITVVLLFFIFLYIAIYSLLKKTMYNAGLAYTEGQAKFIASLFEQMEHIMQIKVDSVQPEFNERSTKAFSGYYQTAIKSQRINYIYTSLDEIVAILAQIVLFVIGGIYVIRGEFTIGMFTIFSSYFRTMLSACRYFFGLAANYQAALVSYNRIKEILNYREESNGETILHDVDTIELRSISFSYETYEHIQIHDNKPSDAADEEAVNIHHIDDDGKRLINDFSYVFTKGNIYALKGENGSGKTTLIKLIIGLYGDEYSGNIYYNDISTAQIDMIQARKNIIGYASQEPLLVEDSLYYNLTYRYYDSDQNGGTINKVDDACEPELFKSCIQFLNMDIFFMKKGCSFMINKNGTNLSGGEKQKMAILKVMYKNPTVMIFDEPTSALDAETKKCFLKYLEQIREDKIIIVVTHDNDLETYCDHVIEVPKMNIQLQTVDK